MEESKPQNLIINFKAVNKINKSNTIEHQIKDMINNTVNNIVVEGKYNTYQEQLLKEYKIIK